MSELAIVEAFLELSDSRREAGKRHQQALCFALFTLAVTAGNRGFLAIGDWLKAYQCELVELFNRPKSGYHPTVRFDVPCCASNISPILLAGRVFLGFNR